MTLPKLKFSWKGNQTLRKEIAAAGKKYYEETAKIEGPQRFHKMFTAAVNVNRGFKHIDPSMQEFAQAFKNLCDLKQKCFEKGLDDSLVDLAALPLDKKYDTGRKFGRKYLTKLIKKAKESGQYLEVD